jgi:teichoic acid transport system ATP-binding protein
MGRQPKHYFREFWALRDVNIEIQKGEIVGIIGPNGAGKSTILQIICGTLSPTIGSVETCGRISALLELGSGFNPDFTGIENIYMNASILGIKKNEIDRKIIDIADFADIGDFIYQPVKTYSSGMYARLAFAVAVCIEPEILIVDETLSVGDLLFQSKAVQRMRELMNRCSVLFVSHSLATIKSFCSRVIYIDGGMIIKDGTPSEVCDHYEMVMQDRLLARERLKEKVRTQLYANDIGDNIKELIYTPDPTFPESGEEFRSGSGSMKVVRADLMVNDRQSKIAEFGSIITLRLLIVAEREIKPGAIVGYMVRNSNAVDVFGRNLFNERMSLPALSPKQMMEVTFRFPCLLTAGCYSISIGVKSEPHFPEFFDLIHVARTFEVANIPGNYVPGMIYVENDINICVLEEGM